jgi:hypothetical protein
MAFGEVLVVQVKELLPRWLDGEGERRCARRWCCPSDGSQLHRGRPLSWGWLGGGPSSN